MAIEVHHGSIRYKLKETNMNLAHNTAILWRGPGSVQVGGDRSRHVLLDNLHAGDQIWLSNQAHPARERE